MSRSNRAEWAKRVERWKDSGLTAKEYAAETGLNASTLSYWKWRLGSEAGADARPSGTRSRPQRRSSSSRKPRSRGRAMARFAELPAELVTVSAPPAMLEVVLGELSVRVPVALDEATLTRVVRAVGAAR